MRLFFVMVLLFKLCFSYCQEHIEPYKLNDQGRLFYDLVYTNDTLNKEQLYARSKTWLTKVFKNAKEVEMYSDKEEGTIIGKGSVALGQDFLSAFGGSNDYLRYTINIFCKDGRSKIVVDNIGFFTVGNKFIDPNDITNLENMYWMNGDTSKKIRTGFKKDKEKKANAIILIVTDWAKAMELEKSGYGDF